MKNIIKIPLIVLIFTGVSVGEDIDTILSKLPSKREATLSKDAILKTPSPMPELIITEKNSTNGNDGNIIAIMNNSANINGKWYKVGQKIGSFEVADIMDDSVFLKSSQKEKILFFENSANKINITLGR